jgi:hypothetical protein
MATNQVSLFNPSQLPAFAVKGELTSIAKALMGGAGASGKRVSIRGGVFRLIAGGKEVAAIEERYLDVIVVNAAPKVSRTFYAKVYDENTPAAPDCWSKDGDTPDPTVKAKQCANCAQCPKNMKGSGQGESRACRYSQLLAVVLANDVEGDVMQLSLAATSLFGKGDGDNRPMQEYARWLAAQSWDPSYVVTRLKFDTTAATPKLFFKAMRPLTSDEYAVCLEKGKSPEAVQAVTMNVSQMDGVGASAPLPAGFSASDKPVAKAAPAAPVVDEDDEPPAPPPKVAKAAKAAKPVLPPEDDEVTEPVVKAAPAKPVTNVPAANGLAKTLAEWDDE